MQNRNTFDLPFIGYIKPLKVEAVVIDITDDWGDILPPNNYYCIYKDHLGYFVPTYIGVNDVEFVRKDTDEIDSFLNSYTESLAKRF